MSAIPLSELYLYSKCPVPFYYFHSIIHDKLVAIYLLHQMDKLMSVTIGDVVRVLHLVILEELKV